MGERLLAFVREVLRQRELLEDAMERDDVAMALVREDEIGRRKRQQGTGRRRIWTRRDKRLLDACDENGPECPRTRRILGRLRPERGEGPHAPLLREALDEARCEGTFSHLAPILEVLAQAHADFFKHASEIADGQCGANIQFPYGDVKDAHDGAVNRVMPFLPPDAVRFDEQYSWDSRHESPILCRDLRQPVTGPKDANVSSLTIEQTSSSHIFISYSHRDERWLNDLQTHLAPFCRDGSVTAWSDQQIATGSKWFLDIQAALAQASVAVLLVTPSFLASDFIHNYELTPILKEAGLGGMRIVWIPVRACAFEKTSLKDYQAVIDPKKPLATMKADRDEAWVTICRKIEKAANRN